MICYLFEAPQYVFFSQEVPGVLYYTHLPTTIIALLIGTYVLIHGPKRRLNQTLFFLSLAFALWTFSSLTAWTSVEADYISFIWPMFAISSSLISILSVYLALTFFKQQEISFRVKVILSLLAAPVLLLAHTDASFSGFDLTNCDAFAYEGFVYKFYYTLLGFISMLWIAIAAIRTYQKSKDKTHKQQIKLMTIGLEFFLFSFITTTFIVTFLVNLGFLNDSRLEMYGLFGMTFFMAIIGILIVRYKTFNIGMLAARALFIALLILVGSQFTYANTTTSVMLSTVTFIITISIGYVLLKSVKQEVKQREKLQELTQKLAAANKRLKKLDRLKSEFVAVASHQLRSPLTAIRGYSSMLLEGSFGSIPNKAKDPLSRIDQSAGNMAMAIEDYLNVSRIESGNMKYEYSTVNLKDQAERVTDDIRTQALKKGLVMTFKSDVDSDCTVYADLGKVIQILHNLINNALKYTPKGSITVFVHDDLQNQVVHVEIIDSGIGMDPATIEHLFEKFERAKGATAINSSGTGLGLFVAKQMAKDMKGDVTAFSEGEGKGSHFILTLPLMK